MLLNIKRSAGDDILPATVFAGPDVSTVLIEKDLLHIICSLHMLEYPTSPLSLRFSRAF